MSTYYWPATGGGSGGVQNPMTSNLDAGGFDITNIGTLSANKLDIPNLIVTVLPSERTAGIQTAINNVPSGASAIIQLTNGTYICSASVTQTDVTKSITIQGAGPGTVLSHDGSFNGYIFEFNPSAAIQPGLAVNNVTYQDTQITMTTAGNAAGVLAGDLITITGTDANGMTDVESHYASANGNAGTGVITLRTPILRTMSSVTIFSTTQIRGGQRNFLKNMSFNLASAPATLAGGYKLVRLLNSGVENLTFDTSWNSAPADVTSGVAVVWDCYNFTDKNTVIESSYNNGIFWSSVLNSQIIEPYIIKSAQATSNSVGGICFNNCSDNVITRPTIDGELTAQGIVQVGSNANRRNQIVNPRIHGSRYRGIDLGAKGSDCSVLGGVIESVTNEYAVFSNSKWNKIQGVSFLNCHYPIYCDLAVGNVITQNIIRNPLSYGVVLTDTSTNNIVGHNFIYTSSSDAGVYGDSAKNIIDANMIVATNKAIVLANSASENLVSSNHVVDSTGITQGTNTTNDFVNNKDI